MVQGLGKALAHVEEGVQILVVLVGNAQFETAAATVAVDHAGRVGEALGLALIGQDVVDALADDPRRVVAALALAPRFQLHLNHGLVGTAEAHDAADALHLGQLLYLVGQSHHHFLGFRHRVARRRAQVNHQRPHVFVGHETRWHHAHQQGHQCHGGSNRAHGQPLPSDEHHRQLGVAPQQGIECGVVGRAHTGTQTLAICSRS